MRTKIELKPSVSVVFIGDSITDAGRLEAAYRPFGYGYVHFVAYRLLAKYPEYNLNIINLVSAVIRFAIWIIDGKKTASITSWTS